MSARNRATPWFRPTRSLDLDQSLSLLSKVLDVRRQVESSDYPMPWAGQKCIACGGPLRTTTLATWGEIGMRAGWIHGEWENIRVPSPVNFGGADAERWWWNSRTVIHTGYSCIRALVRRAEGAFL